MRKVTIFLLAFVLVLAVVPAMAADFTGRITLVHYNSDVPGRGVCVRTTPTGPGTGWFCLWNVNLYTEITDILREAYLRTKTCTLSWDSLDPNGHNLLKVVQCP